MGLNCTLHTFALASIAAAAFCKVSTMGLLQHYRR